MVKRKERKLEYAFKQKEKGVKNKECVYLCGVGIRWFQKLYTEYKMTREIPKLNKSRRPRTYLNDEQIELIDKSINETFFRSAVKLKLHMEKYYNVNLSRNKIHEYLLKRGIAKEDKKKKKQRKYCKYERDHSFSLVHSDYHDSKVFPGKFVCAVEDDASRIILCGGEFDNEEAINTINLIKKAIKIAKEKYSSVIKECNTDKGTQFYNSTFDKDGNRPLGEFELFLKEQKSIIFHLEEIIPKQMEKKKDSSRLMKRIGINLNHLMSLLMVYDMIHLGLSRTEGITPNEAVINKLQPESILGMFWRRLSKIEYLDQTNKQPCINIRILQKAV